MDRQRLYFSWWMKERMAELMREWWLLTVPEPYKGAADGTEEPEYRADDSAEILPIDAT